jgi:type IV secretory pathway VirB4 component
MVKPTAYLIKVQDIRDDVLIMEDDSLRAVLLVPGINFYLLSEGEKELVIGQFKNLLDGLDFPLQILAVSRLANIENYITYLNTVLKTETEPLIKVQLQEYINFLADYIETHRVMKKMFYLVVPYDTAVIEFGRFGRKTTVKDERYQEKLEQLETRIIYLSEKLSIIGLQPIRLQTPELVQLLFEMYNPNLRWGLAPIQLFEDLLHSLR